MEPVKNLRQIFSLPRFLVGGIHYRLSGFLFTPRPRFVCFPVTFRCNSRCQMCNLWQSPKNQEDMGLDKIEEIFSNPLFKKMEEVVLHGGEPTLRNDIHEIYKIILRSCPKVNSITLSTNGLTPKLVGKRVEEILSGVDPDSVRLVFSVSIDGLREAHDEIRGLKGSFDRAVETLEVLKNYQARYPIGLEIITVIQPQNLNDLEKMKDLAEDYEVDIIFQPLMIDTFYGNSSSDPRLQFNQAQDQGYRDFIQNTLTRTKSFRGLYWRNFLEMKAGGKRKVPCAYDRYVLSLYPTGEVLPCSRRDWIRYGNVHEKRVDKIWFDKKAKKIRKRMKKEVCPTCEFYCGAEYALKKEFFVYLYHISRMTLSSLLRVSGAASKHSD